MLRHRVRPFLASALVAIVTACGWVPSPEPGLTPSIVGVVEEETLIAGGERFVLRTGQVVDVSHDSYRFLPLGARGKPGDLLLGGESEGARWFVAFVPRDLPGFSETCYEAIDTGSDAGNAILLDSGLLLPKAPRFDPGSVTDGRYDELTLGGTAQFCLNERGEIWKYRG